jgi:hypothetical protein
VHGITIASLQKFQDIKSTGRGDVNLMSYLVTIVKDKSPDLIKQIHTELSHVGDARHCDSEVAKAGLEQLQKGVQSLLAYETALSKTVADDEQTHDVLERVTKFKMEAGTSLRTAVALYEQAALELKQTRQYLGDFDMPASELFARLDAFIQPFLTV